MDPRVGTEFAGHRIEDVIGRGGASVVYLAEHLRLGRKVALKVLAPHLADDEAFRERFIRESRIAAGLDHPNVVTVYDAGEVEGSLYISMRYVEGSDLGRLLRAEAPLEASRTVSILSQIASALDAAHAQGLVHRDVKPANMLVESVPDIPGLERAYLSDFGISKRTTSREGLTRTGQFVGTVDYVAPEQITGEPVDGRTDVYSLGCVLFECLSGTVPFAGESGVATIYSHLHDPPPELEDFGPQGPGLNRVIAKALAKSLDGRYESCVGLIEAARSELASGAPTTTVAGPGPDEPTAPLVGGPGGAPEPRGRRRAAIAVVGAAVLGTLVWAAIVLPNRGSGTEGRLTGPPSTTSGGSGSSGATGATSPVSGGPTPSNPNDALDLYWSQVYPDPAFAGEGRQAILDAVVTEDGVAVAVGHATLALPVAEEVAAVWRSSNGRKWNPVSSPSFGTEGHQRMIAATEFGGLIVAGGWTGSDAAVWTSATDGKKWRRVASASFGGGGLQYIRDVVSLGSELIAVGSSGNSTERDAAAWRSTDGVTWERIGAADFVAPSQQEVYAATVVGDRVVAVGFTKETGISHPLVWIYDGARWTRVDASAFEESGSQVMLDVAGGDDLPLVAVGCAAQVRCDTADVPSSDAAVWISDDGSSWERVATDDVDLGGPGEQVMRAITVYGDSFAAVGTRASPVLTDVDGAIWTSTDGLSWDTDGPRSPTGSALGSEGDQSLRAIVGFGFRHIELLGFGVKNEGDVEDAAVWRGIDTG
jgi:serine/threonine-protein kinase